MRRSPLDPDALRAHAGEFAWATVVLAAVVVVGFATSIALVAADVTPLWVAGAIHTLLGYASFTVMHEAAHGNIHGKRRWAQRVGDALGWICAAPFLAPFPAFRALHLRHHSHTNDPVRDPDYWVAGSRTLAVAARCLTIVPHYYWAFLAGDASRSSTVRRERTATFVGLGVYLAVATGLVIAGLGVELLVLWVAPAIASTGLLAFLFDWLPHHPHDDTRRFGNTRAIVGPGLVWLTFGQCFHVIHHLNPRIPFFRYATVYRAAEDELRARGVAVLGRPPEDLRAPPQPDRS